MLSKKAVKLWGCWGSRVTQAQMHLLPPSLWGPSSFYSSDNYHKFGCCQSFSIHRFQYFKWETHPSKQYPPGYRCTTKISDLQVARKTNLSRDAAMQNNTLTQLKRLTHIKVSRKESQAIAIAKSLLRTSIHKSRSPAAGIVAPGSERCIAEILIWIGCCSLPQHHSVLLKTHYFMLEVVE